MKPLSIVFLFLGSIGLGMVVGRLIKGAEPDLKFWLALAAMFLFYAAFYSMVRKKQQP